MAYTTPSTWVDGNLVSAADLNAQIRDNVKYLKGTSGVIYLENAIEQAERAVPTTPAAGFGRIYIGNASPNNGIASCVDDAGAIYQMVTRSFGSYTPTYQGATSGGSTTYTTQVGAYERIGDTVFFSAYVAWTAATGTGIVLISLPFTTRNTANLRGSAAIYSNAVTFTGSGVEGLILPNTAYVQLYSPITNATRADVSIETAGDITMSGVFFV